MTLSDRTRINIIQLLKTERINWHGALSADDFLSRLYDLDRLPSYDHRYKTAKGDIVQHSVWTEDWPIDWVFEDRRFNLRHCPEADFLRFLAEMLDPIVRNEDDAKKLLNVMNRKLGDDGYKLVEKTTPFGNTRYEAEGILPGTIAALDDARGIAAELNSEHLEKQIIRMRSSIYTDPSLAIGTSKEFVETICKTILNDRGHKLTGKEDIPKLVQLTREELFHEATQGDKKTQEIVRRMLGSMAGIIYGVTEFRNAYGTGHGKEIKAIPPDPIYAALVVNAAATISLFFYQLYEKEKLK